MGRIIMRLKGWATSAALVLLVPCAPYAATEANFGANTTGDLVELCTSAPDNAVGTAAVNFCEGFAQGAVLVEMQNMVAFRGPKLFCLPNPPPSRNEALSQFVTWARGSPDRMSASATDGLFRFLSERYPCPQSR
jgi:hypothetical protein